MVKLVGRQKTLVLPGVQFEESDVMEVFQEQEGRVRCAIHL